LALLSRRASHGDSDPANTRGADQDTLWLHCSTADRLDAIRDLGCRIKAQHGALTVVLTTFSKSPDVPSLDPGGCDLVEIFTRDSASEARQFLNRWRPDLCLWAGDLYMSTLLDRAAAAGTELMLIDLAPGDLPKSARRRWLLPNPTRNTLNRFSEIFVTSQQSREALRRIGVSGPDIDVAPPLKATATPPSCSASALADVSAMLAGRPVWLAAFAQPSEFEQILDAHRLAMRLAPRLLLVIMPAHPTDSPELERCVALSGLQHINWNDGDEINASTQVVISDGRDEDPGLWFRAAPIGFLASSFSSGTGGQSPEPAAALGAAVIHGPNVGRHRPAYEALRRVGAARTVLDARTLAEAVTSLTAPDLAARMALAGWQCVTEGAPLIDLLTDRVLDRLDQKKVPHART